VRRELTEFSIFASVGIRLGLNQDAVRKVAQEA
jgi:hypothetical protein